MTEKGFTISDTNREVKVNFKIQNLLQDYADRFVDQIWRRGEIGFFPFEGFGRERVSVCADTNQRRSVRSTRTCVLYF